MITPIIDKIAIGDSEDAQNITRHQFDATLNVAIDLDIDDTKIQRYKVGLLDGPGNDPKIFAAALIVLDTLVKNNKRTLVHCHAGQSRSVMIVAAWLAYKKYSTLDDALKLIMPLRKVDIYRQSLYDTAVQSISYVKLLD